MALSDDEINALNESIREANEAMLTMVSTLAAVSNQSAAASTNIQNLNKNVNGASSSINTTSTALNNFRNATSEAEKAERKKNATVLQVVNSLASLAGAVGGFGAALVSSDKSFSKYNSSISSATHGLGGLATVLIPFAGLGKILAGIINLFGMVAQGAAKLGDNLITATDELKSIGTAGSFTSEEFLKLAHDAGVTSANFGILVKPIKSMGPALLALGNSTGEGVIAFTKLAAVTDEERLRLRRIGVDQEGMIASQATFVKLQQMSGVNLSSRYKTELQLQKTSLDYVRNLQDLASLSGVDVEEAKKRQETALNDFRFQSTLIEMERRAATLAKSENPEDQARAQELRDQITLYSKGITDLAVLSPTIADVAKTLLNTKGNITSEIAYMQTLGVDTRKYYEEMTSGNPKAMENFLQDTIDSIGAQISRFGGNVAYLDDATAQELGLKQELVDLYNQQANKEGTLEDRAEQGRIAREKAEKEEYDKIASGRAALTNAEIKAGVALDNVLFPATEGLATGFMKLNGLVNDLSENIDLILGYIPGYESRTELRGDVDRTQETITTSQQQQSDAQAILDNPDTGLIDRMGAELTRNRASTKIKSALEEQANQVIKLVEKGEDVDSSVIDQTIETLEKQVADSVAREKAGSYIVGEREENQRRLDIIASRVNTTFVGPPQPTFVGPPVALATSQSTTSPIRTPSQTIADITNTPVAGTAVTNTVDTTTAPTTANNTNTNTDIDTIMSMLSNKLDNVISLLETGVTIQDGLLIAARN